jgi:hypothetical protein
MFYSIGPPLFELDDQTLHDSFAEGEFCVVRFEQLSQLMEFASLNAGRWAAVDCFVRPLRLSIFSSPMDDGKE